MWYKNIAGRFVGLVTKHACDRQTDRWTDGRTDGQNYDSQDRASIAALRGKNRRSSKLTFTLLSALNDMKCGLADLCIASGPENLEIDIRKLNVTKDTLR